MGCKCVEHWEEATRKTESTNFEEANVNMDLKEIGTGTKAVSRGRLVY
jgi:hypothetical protein